MDVPYSLNPASFEPERNLLFRNNGNGTFTEVAKDLGIANPDGRSLVALWHDFNGDGWPDLYVANDISENKLYINHHGKFDDAGKDAWVEEYRGSMGLAAGDFDRDGDDDLFISHWIAQGFALYQNLLSEQKDKSGKSELHFTDVAATDGIGQPSMQRVGWGTSFVDIDSDGWLDLIVANGSTFEQKESTPRRLTPMPSFLFWNAQGDFFHDLAPWNRSFSQPHVSRGLAVADYNNDGAMDVAIVDQGEGVRLLRNDIPQGHWAEFRLHDRVPPSNAPLGFGDGATVIAWVKGVQLRRDHRKLIVSLAGQPSHSHRPRLCDQDRSPGSSLASWCAGDMDELCGRPDLGHHARRAFGQAFCTASRRHRSACSASCANGQSINPAVLGQAARCHGCNETGTRLC